MKKIRAKYCVLKLLISGPKSEEEITVQIESLNEFSRIKELHWHEGELPTLLRDIIKELISEKKVKQRDILNTRTKELRIEWFIDPVWLSKTKLLKSEIERVRKLAEEEAIRVKAKLELAKQETEEKKKRQQIEKMELEKQLKLNREKLNPPKPNKESNNSGNSETSLNSIINVILSLVAVIGGIYVIGKVGDSLSRAITFPVFLITCLVIYSIYYLSKTKGK